MDHKQEFKHKISCKRCQIRKIKCSRVFPCSSCVAASAVCDFRSDDVKRRPAAKAYVTALENRVARLEACLEKMRDASPEERDEIIRKNLVKDHIFHGGERPIKSEECPPSPVPTGKSFLQMGAQGSLEFHGPTSIRQQDLFNYMPTPDLPDLPDPRRASTPIDYGVEYPESEISHLLRLFFRWQYPHFMFINREIFLGDHMDRAYGGRYWSLPLLYSVCSLGARVSYDPHMRALGAEMASRSLSILLAYGLDRPHITFIQAFLCLACLEIQQGNYSKCWLLSGIAFRMGQDLGFQRDPMLWISEDISLQSTEDLEIRRRIYWGCYVSDKLICLYLGRPHLLDEEDASVESTEMLPDTTDYTARLYAESSDGEPMPEPIDGLIVSFDCFAKLCHIIQKVLSRIFSPKASSRIAQPQNNEISTLTALNLELERWHINLPEVLRWHRWTPPSEVIMPHVAWLHVLFHSVRICLNKDFVATDPEAPKLCEDSIETIAAVMRFWRRQYGLRFAPFTFVYGLVVSIRAATALKTSQGAVVASDARIDFFLRCLEECSFAWAFAADARKNMVRTIDAARSSKSLPSTPDQQNEQVFTNQSSPSYEHETTDKKRPTQFDSVTSYPEPVPTDTFDFETFNNFLNNTGGPAVDNGPFPDFDMSDFLHLDDGTAGGIAG